MLLRSSGISRRPPILVEAGSRAQGISELPAPACRRKRRQEQGGQAVGLLRGREATVNISSPKREQTLGPERKV
jgi:hypothetical protein